MGEGASQRVFALLLVLALTSSAMALQQQKLYRTKTGQEPGDFQQGGFIAIQQHATFVEFVTVGEEARIENIVEYAAIVGLVKKCKVAERRVDNAVLWFNDHFLFGNKSSGKRNETTGPIMGGNPVRNISDADLFDRNRNNGTGRYNATTGFHEVNESGTGPHEGGNPDRDGFVRAQDQAERWGGCWIPRGFVHVVRSGQIGSARQAIEDDHACGGCRLLYQGTLYVTDPNNHRWVVDKHTYGSQRIYTVHLQIDPWNPDRQGFPDEAIWAYREDGRLRLGLPYSEDLSSPMGGKCHDEAEVDGEERYAIGHGSSHKADAYEYDNMKEDGGVYPKHTAAEASGTGSGNWTHFRRGPVGNTVECAIEYNFLLAIPVRDFGSGGTVRHGEGRPDDSNAAWRGNSHPHNPERERCAVVNDTCWQLAPGAEGWSGYEHDHRTARVDVFFSTRASYFVEQHPYWDHANRTDKIITFGTPPVVSSDCELALRLPPSDNRYQAVKARRPILCDVDSVDGFHLHDGSQTIPPRR